MNDGVHRQTGVSVTNKDWANKDWLKPVESKETLPWLVRFMMAWAFVGAAVFGGIVAALVLYAVRAW